MSLEISLENIKECLHFEIDNIRESIDEKTYISRKKFWNDVYIDRPIELDVLKKFFKSRASVLFLTGRIGTGKSTFIRHKFEKESLLSGIIFDSRSISKSLKGYDSISDCLYSEIKESYLNSILLNIKICATLNKSYKNFDHQIEPAEFQNLIDLEFDENELNLDISARKILAQHILHKVIKNKELRKIRTALKIKFNTESEFISRTNTPLEDEELVDKIINIINIADAIWLYRRLDNSKRPHVIVIDNLDRLDLKFIKDQIFEAVIDLLSTINRDNQVPKNKISKYSAIRIAINVRDENISRVRIEGRGAKRVFHLKLDKYAYLLPDVQNQHNLSIDFAFAHKVVTKRLIAAAELIKEAGISLEDFKYFKRIVTGFWLDDTSESVKEKIGYFSVKDLCNDSLRLLMTVIYLTSKDILILFKNIGIPRNKIMDYLPNQLVRGRLIYNLWKLDSTKQLMESFSYHQLNSNEIESCDLKRLILTYLYNQYQRQCLTKMLFEDLHKILGLRYQNQIKEQFPEESLESIKSKAEIKFKADVKEAIHMLFESGERQGELISIYQTDLISNAKEISNDSILNLNPKGVVFLEKVLINIDYTLKIFGTANKSFYEHTIEEILVVYVQMFKKLMKVKSNHISYYKTHIKQNLGSQPFKEYSKYFTIGNTFYIGRILGSHQTTLRTYIESFIFGNKSNILYLQSDIEQIEYLEKPTKHLDFDHLKEFYKENSIKNNRSIVDLIEIQNNIHQALANIASERTSN